MTDHEQPSESRPVVVAGPAQPPLSPVRLMVYTLAILFVIGMVWFLIQIRSIILLLILGILLAAAIEPLVNRIRRYGLSRGQSILAIYVLIFAILGVTLYAIAPPLIRQGTGLVENAPEYVAQFQEQARTSNNDFIRTSGVRAINRAEAILSDLLESPPIEATQAISVLTSVFGILFTTASVMIVAFYWMTEKAIIKRVVLSLFPIDRRDRAHGMWDQIESKIGGWTRGQLILMIVIGLLSTIAYSPIVLDLEFWFLIGIFAGLTELVPFIGPVIGGALAFVVALTDSWQKAMLVMLFVVVLQQVEGSVLVPRIMRNAVGLTPLSVILAVLVGGTLMGPLGAVLAIPVAAAVQVLVQDLLRAREESADTGATGDAVMEMLTSHPTVHREPRGAGAASYSVAGLQGEGSRRAARPSDRTR